MDDQCMKKWTSPDLRLVFEVADASNPNAEAVVTVFDTQCPDQQFIVLVPADGTQLDAGNIFPSGYVLQGWLQRLSKVTPNGQGHTGIWGDLRFDMPPRQQQFEGFIAYGEARPGPPVPPVPPDPPVPPGPDAPLPPLPVSGSPRAELFPYIYMRKWPRVPPDALALNFVQYAPPDPPEPDSLYAQLLAATLRGEREDLALRFIAGDPPFQGQYLGDAGEPDAPAAPLVFVAADLALWLDEPGAAPEQLLLRLQYLFGVDGYSAMSARLAQADYRAAVQRLWQNWFALAIMPGYARPLFELVASWLVSAHALERLFPVAPDGAVAPLPRREPVRELAGASVVLPAPVFPLPPAAPAPGAGSGSGWIEPYAIGELQMVRQHLRRHVPGELARTENVMPGERKEVCHRRVRRDSERRETLSDSAELLDSVDCATRGSLFEELRNTIAEQEVDHVYDNFTTTYGPPTQATMNGKWTESTLQGARPGGAAALRHAQSLLDKALRRVAQQVREARSNSTLHETQDSVLSVLDNSSGAAALLGVYHWINKVYEAEVISYGNRLVVEFMLREPAAAYIDGQRRLWGQQYGRPPALESLGVASFRDITPDNYPKLAARYGVTALEAPPASNRTVSVALRGGEERLLPVPPGYVAAAARVSWLAVPAGSPAPVVLVGAEKFDGGQPPPKRRFGQDGAIAVSVAPAAPGPAGGDVPLQAPPEVQVSVDVICVPLPATMDNWRIRIHGALVQAFRQRLDEYRAQAGLHDEAPPARAPGAVRQVERQALRRGCLQLLMERRAAMVGPQDEPAGEPRYLEFFDGLFEWGEMSCRWYGGADDPGDPQFTGGDAGFAAFLNAGMARVMLPVRPERSMALLYFLSSGMAWDGDRAVPVLAADIAAVYDLKTARVQEVQGPGPVRVGEPWEVVVPTTMQILGNRL